MRAALLATMAAAVALPAAAGAQSSCSDPCVVAYSDARPFTDESAINFGVSGGGGAEWTRLYRIDFGDGSGATYDAETYNGWTHSYAPGSYVVTIWGRINYPGFGEGDQSRKYYLTVRNDRPPIASLGVTPGLRRATAPMTFNFNPSLSADQIIDGDVPASPLVRYTMSYGDGSANDTSGQSRQFSHTFALPGEYDVELTVEDGAGQTDSTSMTFQLEKSTTAITPAQGTVAVTGANATVSMSATLTRTSSVTIPTGVYGQTVYFGTEGQLVCAGTTGLDGVARCSGPIPSTMAPGAILRGYVAAFFGSDQYLPATTTSGQLSATTALSRQTTTQQRKACRKVMRKLKRDKRARKHLRLKGCRR